MSAWFLDSELSTCFSLLVISIYMQVAIVLSGHLDLSAYSAYVAIVTCLAS